MINAISRGDGSLDPRVKSAFEAALERGMSVEETRQQKLSYIMGMLGRDSTLTREEVERMLAEREGGV